MILYTSDPDARVLYDNDEANTDKCKQMVYMQVSYSFIVVIIFNNYYEN